MEEDNQVLTLQEYIEKERSLELEAAYALPAKFDACTYDIGYTRQHVYVCQSCMVDKNKPAAICYSCSIACHTHCDLVELLAKRHFRCDCGNSLFREKCSLYGGQKDPENLENCYDGRDRHNYFGRFCTCDKLHDAQAEERDMYQCLVCQDWFHETCIGISDPDDFDEMICAGCVESHPFLSGSGQCAAATLRDGILHECLFLQEGWRSHLCRCDQCLELYKHHRVEFVLEEEPVYMPEPDEDASSSTYEKGMQLLSKYEGPLLSEGIYGIKMIKNALTKFLDAISSEKRIVTEQDIYEFVSQNKKLFNPSTNIRAGY